MCDTWRKQFSTQVPFYLQKKICLIVTLRNLNRNYKIRTTEVASCNNDCINFQIRVDISIIARHDRTRGLSTFVTGATLSCKATGVFTPRNSRLHSDIRRFQPSPVVYDAKANSSRSSYAICRKANLPATRGIACDDANCVDSLWKEGLRRFLFSPPLALAVPPLQISIHL